jgi:hypothetical protein
MTTDFLQFIDTIFHHAKDSQLFAARLVVVVVCLIPSNEEVLVYDELFPELLYLCW